MHRIVCHALDVFIVGSFGLVPYHESLSHSVQNWSSKRTTAVLQKHQRRCHAKIANVPPPYLLACKMLYAALLKIATFLCLGQPVTHLLPILKTIDPDATGNPFKTPDNWLGMRHGTRANMYYQNLLLKMRSVVKNVRLQPARCGPWTES